MSILNSIFKGIFKGKVDQIEQSLKDDPILKQKSKELSQSVTELTEYIGQNITIKYIPWKIISNSPFDEGEKLVYNKNKSYIDGLVELYHELNKQIDELTKFVYDNFCDLEDTFDDLKDYVESRKPKDNFDRKPIKYEEEFDRKRLLYINKQYHFKLPNFDEWSNLVFTKPHNLLRIIEYVRDRGFETREVIQSAREEMEKIKTEFLRKNKVEQVTEHGEQIENQIEERIKPDNSIVKNIAVKRTELTSLTEYLNHPKNNFSGEKFKVVKILIEHIENAIREEFPTVIFKYSPSGISLYADPGGKSKFAGIFINKALAQIVLIRDHRHEYRKPIVNGIKAINRVNELGWIDWYKFELSSNYEFEKNKEQVIQLFRESLDMKVKFPDKILKEKNFTGKNASLLTKYLDPDYTYVVEGEATADKNSNAEQDQV